MSIGNEVPRDVIDIKRQMAQLIVRELEESVVRALKLLAMPNVGEDADFAIERDAPASTYLRASAPSNRRAPPAP